MNSTVRRLAIGAGFGFAFTVGALAVSSAAHADDKPALIDCPGGAVDQAVRLPEKAAARAKAVVAEVAPEPKRDEPADETEPVVTPPAPEPTTEPEPAPTPTEEPVEEPTEEPDPATQPRTTEPDPVVEPPADPVVVVPPVVVDTPPVVIDPTPTPDPVVMTVPDPVVILPSDGPAPLPDADAPTTPTPRVGVGPVVLPVPPVLPAIVGPIAAPVAEVADEAPDAAAVTEAEPECTDQEVAIHVDGDLIQQLIASFTAPAAPRKAKAKTGCPTKPSSPAGPHVDCTPGTANNSGTGGGAIFTAAPPDQLTAPALARLEHTRPRCHLPASRHIAIEPGPA